MSLLDRLLHAKAPAIAPTAVVIDPELAAVLSAGGEPLERAVNTSLRAYLAARDEPTPAQPSAAERMAPEPKAAERMPFWLERDSERDTALEEQLRDRTIHRRESESNDRA